MKDIPEEGEKRCFLCLSDQVIGYCKKCCLLENINSTPIYYCSNEHLAVHSPSNSSSNNHHRTPCFPFVVTYSDDVGKYVVASRHIKAQELIMCDSTFLMGPSLPNKEDIPEPDDKTGNCNSNEVDSDSKTKTCDEMETTTVPCIICSKLISVNYDHFEMEKNDKSALSVTNACHECQWPVCHTCFLKQLKGNDEPVNDSKQQVHKNDRIKSAMTSKSIYIHRSLECKVLRGVDWTVSDSYKYIIHLRFALMKYEMPEEYMKLTTLMDHVVDRRKDVLLPFDQHEILVEKFIREVCKQKYEMTCDEIYKICGIIWTNAIGSSNCISTRNDIKTSTTNEIDEDAEKSDLFGCKYVFPNISLLSHSCHCNSDVVVMPGKWAALQAKTDIEKGEEINISYISLLQSRTRRRKKLREKWYFECSCERCEDLEEFGTNLSTMNVSCYYSSMMIDEMSSDKDEITIRIEDRFLLELNAKMKSRNNLKDEVGNNLESTDDTEKHVTGRGEELEKLLNSWKTTKVLHENHYIILLLKRYILMEHSSQSNEFRNDMDLDRLLHFEQDCKTILNIYNKILYESRCENRGIVLRHLANISKAITKKRFQMGMIDDVKFVDEIKKCSKYFDESQNCITMLFRKV